MNGRWRLAMLARSTTEEHRAATPLELFFDLCFVVAVAQAASQLHHALSAGHVGAGLLGYVLVFFAIWWAWMNFTWFASAYDTDDVPYRLATLVQIAGALIIAAGVPRAFGARDLSVVVIGYVIMRLALVSQWLRAASADNPGRRTALRYAIGMSICQVYWVALLAVPASWRFYGFLLGAVAELAVPVWAERAGFTAWHPHHIAERYGLFTLIVLGESVAAATLAIQSGLDDANAVGGLLTVAGIGLLIVFAMWWFYFDQPAGQLLERVRDREAYHVSFLWGYGHLIVFASAAALGAGLEVAVDHVLGKSHISGAGAGAAVAIPVAVYMISVWLLHAMPDRRR